MAFILLVIPAFVDFEDSEKQKVSLEQFSMFDIEMSFARHMHNIADQLLDPGRRSFSTNVPVSMRRDLMGWAAHGSLAYRGQTSASLYHTAFFNVEVLHTYF